MTADPITVAEVEQYRAFVGRTVVNEDVVDRRVAQMLAATLDEGLPPKHLPPLWHYGLFLPFVPTPELDGDGHPKRGDFLPPVRLPRRMFAGASLKFQRPLSIGESASRVSRIAAVDHRQGKTGDLVFVRVSSVVSQRETPCFEEEQTIVYRPGGGETAAVVPAARSQPAVGETAVIWLPTSVELFRYSAATFNGHRIHYDVPYVTNTEGYPGLVVHGPLIATRLCAFARRVGAGDLATFAFRGEAPIFVGQEVRLVGSCEGKKVTVRAERADGMTAMSATATVR